MQQAIRTTLAAFLFSLAGSGLAGCVGYASYPPIESATPSSTNPNAPPIDELMMLAVKWVADRYPPPHAGPGVAGEATFAINLPVGVRRDVYERVSAKTGGLGVPVTAENMKTLPVYHIARVWVRMRDAKVDVLRPRLELPRKVDGQPVYECITLICDGGMQPWRVVRFQTWEVGVVDTPLLYYCPEDYGTMAYPLPPAGSKKKAEPVFDERGVDPNGVPMSQPVGDVPKPVAEPGEEG